MNSAQRKTLSAIFAERPLDVSVRIDPGKLEPEELLVELMIGQKDGSGFAEPPECVSLRPDGKDPETTKYEQHPE
jgi:hypothetical protein